MRNTEAETLKAARQAYNEYLAEVVRPAFAISESEQNRLTEAEIAKQIADPQVRKEFVSRSIAMLEANVRYYRDSATPQKATLSAGAIPVVSSLLAAAVGYSVGGVVAAFVLAAVGYWLGHRHAEKIRGERNRAATGHNADVDDWRKTVEEWELSVRELRDL